MRATKHTRHWRGEKQVKRRDGQGGPVSGPTLAVAPNVAAGGIGAWGPPARAGVAFQPRNPEKTILPPGYA